MQITPQFGPFPIRFFGRCSDDPSLLKGRDWIITP